MLRAVLVAVIAAAAAGQQPSYPSKFTPAIANRADVKQALSYVDQHFDQPGRRMDRGHRDPGASTHEQQRAAYVRRVGEDRA